MYPLAAEQRSCGGPGPDPNARNLKRNPKTATALAHRARGLRLEKSVRAQASRDTRIKTGLCVPALVINQEHNMAHRNRAADRTRGRMGTPPKQAIINAKAIYKQNVLQRAPQANFKNYRKNLTDP